MLVRQFIVLLYSDWNSHRPSIWVPNRCSWKVKQVLTTWDLSASSNFCWRTLNAFTRNNWKYGFMPHTGPEGLLYRSLQKTEGFGRDILLSQRAWRAPSLPANASSTDNQQFPLLLRRGVCFRKYMAVKRYSLQLPLLLQWCSFLN